jgi:hypothetical protein
MNGVRVSNHQDLFVVFLKRPDYEMLSEVGHVDTLDCIDARKPARSLDQ